MDIESILIVDDLPENIDILREILTSNGYKVRIATSGSAAIKTVQMEMPQLILMDIVMPEMDGFETWNYIKNISGSDETRVIFISALSNISNKVKAFECGGVDYITKPFDEKEVIARVKSQFELIGSKKELIKSSYWLNKQQGIIDRNVLLVRTDINGKIVYVSKAYSRLTGYEESDLLGNTHSIVRDQETTDKVYKELWDTIKQNKTWSSELKNRRKDGTFFWIQAIIEPYYNELNQVIGYYAVYQDITDKKIIEQISITDELTGLYNRRFFNNTLKKEISRNKRDNKSLVFLIMDIDYFKQYNDTYGHKAGDDALSKIGETLKETMQRGSDFVFRLGGEEFGILFSGIDIQASKEIAKNIRAAVEELHIPHVKNSASSWVTISIGMVFIDADNKKVNSDNIYMMADKALYKAKDKGRNLVWVYDD